MGRRAWPGDRVVPKHVVAQGECVTSIADHYGFFWQTVWDHPDNHELKRLRKNPNVLCVGDELSIPDKAPREESCASEEKHRFRLKGVPAKLRVHLEENGKPLKNLDYKLDIDGKVVEGTTDGEGLVEASIPPGARSAVLYVDHGARVYHLDLGHVDPVDDLAGVQQRLKNMGFFFRPIDGKESPQLTQAISRFQAAQGLDATGELDDDTKKKLEDAHAS